MCLKKRRTPLRLGLNTFLASRMDLSQREMEPKAPSSISSRGNSEDKLMVVLFALLFFLIGVSVVAVLFVVGEIAVTVVTAEGTSFDPITETKNLTDTTGREASTPSKPNLATVEIMETTVKLMESTVELTESTVELMKTTHSPPKAEGPETLLCTYGEGTRADEIMAEDGLCDYAFFVSLYDDDTKTLSDSKPRGHDLRTFMRAGRIYTKTALGLAFAFQKLARAFADMTRTHTNPLEEFWRIRIFHAGVLDAPEKTTGQQMVVPIRLLKMIRDHASARGHRTLTALAAPTPEPDWATFLSEQGKKLGHYPDLFVVHGHYRFGDNTVKPCAVMPPTRYSSVDPPKEFSSDYRFDLATGTFTLRELQSKNVSSRGFLSVTMKGRWTSPSLGKPFEFYSHCDTDRSAESFGSYTEVCGDRYFAPQLQYKPDHYAVLTHHSSQRRAFAYDNEEGLRTKLCRLKGEVQEVSFGIAAFDVDYDDYSNECSSLNKFGSHSRLKTLRKIVDYYKSLASDHFDEAWCSIVVG